MLEDHLHFCCHVFWMYGCSFLVNISTKKENLSIKAMADFRKTWYVDSGGTSTTHVVCRHQMANAHIQYLICISVLIG